MGTRRVRLVARALCRGAAVTTLVALGSPAAAQELAPLPALPLEALEEPARAQIAQALKAVEAEPRDASRNGRLGMLLYANEQYESAATCFDRARSLAPAEARWPYYLAKARSNLSSHEAAAAGARDVLRMRPDYLPARLLLARSLLDAGQAEDARTLYAAIAREHPEAAEAHYGLGRVGLAAGRAADAVAPLQKACELSPAFGAAHFALARAYRDLGEKEKAQEQLELYQKDKLGWPAIPDPLLAEVLALKTGALARLQKAIELADAGQLQPAVDEHEAALAVDSTLVQAHVNLIRLYGTLGRPEKAEEHYRAAVALHPGLAEIHYNHGVLLAGTKRSSEASESFRRAIELNPAYAEAHYNYGYLLMAASRLDEAAAHFRTALEHKPGYREARFNLGRLLVWQGRLPEAIEQLRQTLTPEDGETPRCAYALGAAYARAGDREQARRYMTQARDKALGLAQLDLVSSIDRDLRALATGTAAPR